MWELDHKEVWGQKNWCFQTVVLEKTLESSLNKKETKSVNPKGNQPWIFIGRIDAEAEAPILWLHDVKSQIIGKDPDAGKDWGQEKKGTTEDEMVGGHHQFNEHEFKRTPGDSEGQRTLAGCNSWVVKCQTWFRNWTTIQKDIHSAQLSKKSILFYLKSSLFHMSLKLLCFWEPLQGLILLVHNYDR